MSLAVPGKRESKLLFADRLDSIATAGILLWKMMSCGSTQSTARHIKKKKNSNTRFQFWMLFQVNKKQSSHTATGVWLGLIMLPVPVKKRFHKEISKFLLRPPIFVLRENLWVCFEIPKHCRHCWIKLRHLFWLRRVRRLRQNYSENSLIT